MAQFPIPFPLVQGVRFDHSSLDIKLSGQSFFGVKSIDWKDEMKPGEAYGTSAQRLGTTRGQYKASGNIELWKAEALSFEQLLIQQFPSIGLLEIRFPIDVNYVMEGGIGPFTANLVACRITDRSDSSSAGSEPHAKKYALDVTYVIENGLLPITGLRK